MRLVTVVFTALSLGACNVEGPGSGKAKFTPEGNMDWKGAGAVKMEVAGEHLLYVLATADKEGYPPQRFVFTTKIMSTYLPPGTARVDIWAVNENLKPLPGQNDCVDRFTHPSPGNNSLTIPKGRKKVKIEWSSDGPPHTITAFEYTVIGSDNEPVTYRYKNQNATPENVPTVGKLTNDQWVELMVGDDCDHVSQSGEEGSGAPGG